MGGRHGIPSPEAEREAGQAQSPKSVGQAGQGNKEDLRQRKEEGVSQDHPFHAPHDVLPGVGPAVGQEIDLFPGFFACRRLEDTGNQVFDVEQGRLLFPLPEKGNDPPPHELHEQHGFLLPPAVDRTGPQDSGGYCVPDFLDGFLSPSFCQSVKGNRARRQALVGRLTRRGRAGCGDGGDIDEPLDLLFFPETGGKEIPGEEVIGPFVDLGRGGSDAAGEMEHIILAPDRLLEEGKVLRVTSDHLHPEFPGKAFPAAGPEETGYPPSSGRELGREVASDETGGTGDQGSRKHRSFYSASCG